MAKIMLNQESLVITGTRTAPPTIRREEFSPFWIIFFATIVILASIKLIEGVPGKNMIFNTLIVITLFSGLGVLIYKLYMASLVKFRIDKNNESINFFDNLGKQQSVYYFRDIKNLRITYGIEKTVRTVRTQNRMGAYFSSSTSLDRHLGPGLSSIKQLASSIADSPQGTYVAKEKMLYILDVITTVDSSYTIHVDDEAVIKEMAKIISQFIDRPVHNEGCRRLD